MRDGHGTLWSHLPHFHARRLTSWPSLTDPPGALVGRRGSRTPAPARGPTPVLTCVALRRTTPIHTEHNRPRSPLVGYAPFLLHSCLMLVEEQYAYTSVLKIPRMILRVMRKSVCCQ